MKKLFSLALAVVLAVSLLLVFPFENTYAAKDTNVKKLNYSMVPSMGAIKLKWKKKDVSCYQIYRVSFAKSDTTMDYVPFSKYKKVARISGKKTSWTDKKVKKNRYYAYVIRGYRKNKDSKVRVYDSYSKHSLHSEIPGLDKPEIFNDGDGENYTNSKDRIYLYVQRNYGVRPHGAVIYRKAAGSSKYSKITVKKMSSSKFTEGAEYRDSTVKPGKTYYYKARTWVKKNGKKKYSRYSKAVKISAVNYRGKYTVEPVTAAGTVNEFAVKVNSNKYNGVLTLKGIEDPDVYYCAEEDIKQTIKLTAYGSDGKTWIEVPSSGLKIKAGQSIYLKYAFTEGSGYFGGKTGSCSDVYMNNVVDYSGGGHHGGIVFALKLKEGTGSAYCDFLD